VIKIVFINENLISSVDNYFWTV